jgi:POT family proton-dependent oligopeptide transporter
LANYGPHLAFGIPGVLMAMATVFFWMGRKVFVHIPPGGVAFLKETFSKKGLGSLGRLLVIYAFVAMFWALFDQTGSAWVLQAEKLDRTFLGVEWLPSQIQAINPITILVFIPIFNGISALKWPGLYTIISRTWALTPLRKIGIGFFMTVPAFLIPSWIESQLAAGVEVNIAWQLFAYVVLTAAEVFVSITCLEFSYVQAPKKMKSLVMACFLMSVSLGNIFVAAVNFFIQNEDGSSKLSGADYYNFFALCMLATAIIFIPVAMGYKEERHMQDEEGSDDDGAPPMPPKKTSLLGAETVSDEA